MTSTLDDAGWTPAAAAVLERACDHYGGLETWVALRRIRLIPERISGFIPWLKGAGRTFRFPSAFEVEPKERRARFLHYPDEDHDGLFENGVVSLMRREGGAVVARAGDQRQRLRGLAVHRRWTPLDALYFFGYALTHYHSLPFTLLESRLVRMRTSGSRSDPLHALDVELPADLPTHCRRQSFYFDRTGRLTRHDYHAEVVGFWAHGAHFWKRQASFKGFPVALERQVVARLGSMPCPVTALHAIFSDAEVELDAPCPARVPSRR
jgi:hypothetical protein